MDAYAFWLRTFVGSSFLNFCWLNFGDVLLMFLCDIHTVTCACDLMKMVHRQQVFDHENGVLKINTESRESWL